MTWVQLFFFNLSGFFFSKMTSYSALAMTFQQLQYHGENLQFELELKSIKNLSFGLVSFAFCGNFLSAYWSPLGQKGYRLHFVRFFHFCHVETVMVFSFVYFVACPGLE